MVVPSCTRSSRVSWCVREQSREHRGFRSRLFMDAFGASVLSDWEGHYKAGLLDLREHYLFQPGLSESGVQLEGIRVNI
jgi:hypothetical protein